MVSSNTASEMLLNCAAAWLGNKGMKVMRGPWSFVSQEWGLVIEGFIPSPVLMAPYNPSYYENHMVAFDLHKLRMVLYIIFQ